MRKRPWFKFHPQDWLSDAHLRMCSPAAHGLLINLMGFAHSGDPYGYLTNGGMAIGPQEASRILAWNRQTVGKAWAELEQHGRLRQSECGSWYIPRMVKDFAYTLQQSELGKQGGNPTLKAPLKTHLKPEENRSDTESDTENTPQPPRGGGDGRKRKRGLTKEQKRRAKVDQNTNEMIIIGGWFGRNESTLWSIYEAEALAEMSPIGETDLADMGRYYTQKYMDPDYRRRDIPTLLNNWQGELDRARNCIGKKRSLGTGGL